jgi:hypothetical protein
MKWEHDAELRVVWFLGLEHIKQFNNSCMTIDKLDLISSGR